MAKNENKWIWFDCDGTWIDLYGVEGWLEMLINNDPTPYAIAQPLVNLSWFARTIHELQNKGFKIGIISWLSKNGTIEYNNIVTQIKLQYFQKHLPSVQFDKIYIIPYGTPKSTCGNGILFDDEENNRKDWKGIAFDEKNLIKNLRNILKNFG
jgi:hypothetical protein